MKRNPTHSAEERKLRDLYDAFEDTKAIEAAGLSPVKADLAHIAALNSPADVAAFMASPATQVGGPFAMRIGVDPKNPSAYAIRLGQSGLGMPDRDYYLRHRQADRGDARRLQEISSSTC